MTSIGAEYDLQACFFSSRSAGGQFKAETECCQKIAESTLPLSVANRMQCWRNN